MLRWIKCYSDAWPEQGSFQQSVAFCSRDWLKLKRQFLWLMTDTSNYLSCLTQWNSSAAPTQQQLDDCLCSLQRWGRSCKTVLTTVLTHPSSETSVICWWVVNSLPAFTRALQCNQGLNCSTNMFSDIMKEIMSTYFDLPCSLLATTDYRRLTKHLGQLAVWRNVVM